MYRETAVALEQLSVSEDAHFAHVEAGVGGEDARGDEVGLFEGGYGVSKTSVY